MSHFTKEEFACSCCGVNRMSSIFMPMIENARIYAGIPFHINSGYRCEKRNAEVGGKPASSHLSGYAVDIRAKNSRERSAVLRGLIAAGFTRIGIGKNFIHADMDPDKDINVIWTYY